MLTTRVIPVLLLKGNGLYKSVKFGNHRYIGDPVNAIKIFNEKGVDELVVFDIEASQRKRPPNFKLIQNMANQAFMPLAYGGGIKSVEEGLKLFKIGVEKLVFNSSIESNSKAISQLSNEVGKQSIVGCVDVKRSFFGKPRAYTLAGKKSSGLSPVEMVKKAESLGVGELIINSIDRDGTYEGYDINLIQEVRGVTNLPIIASGGASKLEDFRIAIKVGGANAVAAGSLFVYHGKHRAVLITYPSLLELEELFGQ